MLEGVGKTDTTTIRVRGYHEDRFGHVNNARYLEFLEEARWAYLERRGPQGGLDALGVLPVVVRLDIAYRRPAVAGDELRIETRLADVGRRRFTLQQVVRTGGDERPCCTAEVTVALVDKRTGHSVVLTEAIRQAWPDLKAAT